MELVAISYKLAAVHMSYVHLNPVESRIQFVFACVCALYVVYLRRYYRFLARASCASSPKKYIHALLLFLSPPLAPRFYFTRVFSFWALGFRRFLGKRVSRGSSWVFAVGRRRGGGGGSADFAVHRRRGYRIEDRGRRG
jgi:hypothetical protein